MKNWAVTITWIDAEENVHTSSAVFRNDTFPVVLAYLNLYGDAEVQDVLVETFEDEPPQE